MDEREKKPSPLNVSSEAENRTSADREEFLATLRHGRPVNAHRKSYYPGADSYHPSRAIKSSVKSS